MYCNIIHIENSERIISLFTGVFRSIYVLKFEILYCKRQTIYGNEGLYCRPIMKANCIKNHIQIDFSFVFMLLGRYLKCYKNKNIFFEY